MADYTLVNLREVEDLAPRFGYSPGLESRFARGALGLEKSGLSYFRVAPGFRIPFGHRHHQQEEVYLVVSGGARIKVGEEIVELRPFDALRVPPEAERAFEAGPDGAEIVAFGAPSTDGNDAEMLRDWWTD
ncbi:MAG: cupin domain-containing protein [Thermoleophilaceae bacterium]|nr:cupin domain-containing protein [Thermoleophilaceae bacterium]